MQQENIIHVASAPKGDLQIYKVLWVKGCPRQILGLCDLSNTLDCSNCLNVMNTAINCMKRL